MTEKLGLNLRPENQNSNWMLEQPGSLLLLVQLVELALKIGNQLGFGRYQTVNLTETHYLRKVGVVEEGLDPLRLLQTWS